MLSALLGGTIFPLFVADPRTVRLSHSGNPSHRLLPDTGPVVRIAMWNCRRTPRMGGSVVMVRAPSAGGGLHGEAGEFPFEDAVGGALGGDAVLVEEGALHSDVRAVVVTSLRGGAATTAAVKSLAPAEAGSTFPADPPSFRHHKRNSAIETRNRCYCSGKSGNNVPAKLPIYCHQNRNLATEKRNLQQRCRFSRHVAESHK